MALLIVFGALGLARFSYTSILPAMQQGLGLSNTQAGGLATANLAGYLLVGIVAGALAARVGPRRVIFAGLVVAAAGMLLTGVSHSYALALTGRVFTGFGSAAANIPAHTLVGLWFSRARGPRDRGGQFGRVARPDRVGPSRAVDPQQLWRFGLARVVVRFGRGYVRARRRRSPRFA